MSHISEAKAKIIIKDRELLVKALSNLGLVLENEIIYSYQGGETYYPSKEKYEIVLVNEKHSQQRVGFNYTSKKEEYDVFYDNYGSCGTFAKNSTKKAEDWYLAYHYEKELTEEGFDVEIHQLANGELEVLAEEQIA